jgi:assimilatory nitrate reductase catalytic subunit
MLGRALDAVQRIALIAACTAEDLDGADRIVCACFSIGHKRIAAAICDKGLKNTSDIGATTKAGTNCGSCLPELRQLLSKMALAPAS